jgi:hypothetical protein
MAVGVPMKSTCRPLQVLSILILLCASNFPVFGQDATSQIKAEIGRLKESLREKPVSSPDLPGLNAMIEDSLRAASEALNSGRLYLLSLA